jgi:hypothetical protein
MLANPRLWFGILTVTFGQALAAQAPPACVEDASYHLLDFWVGSWNVFVEDSLVGTDRVEKILDGCAIEETWHTPAGTEGISLFYVDPRAGIWKQVWVTTGARQPGGVKEKRMIARGAKRGTRFQGEITLPEGRIMLDRTTLTPLGDDEVRQLIETSTDGGETWRTTFDARYRRAPAGPR